jgi:hypothetical protein
MLPEPPPDPHPGIPEPRNAPIVDRAASAEEEAATASAATRDWAIAPTPIPPEAYVGLPRGRRHDDPARSVETSLP